MAIYRKSAPKPAGSLAGKIGFTLFGLVFLMMGLFFIKVMLSDFSRNIYAGAGKRPPALFSAAGSRRFPTGTGS